MKSTFGNTIFIGFFIVLVIFIEAHVGEMAVKIIESDHNLEYTNNVFLACLYAVFGYVLYNIKPEMNADREEKYALIIMYLFTLMFFCMALLTLGTSIAGFFAAYHEVIDQ